MPARGNLLTLRFSDTKERTYNPRGAFGVDIYTAEKRQLAVGERIQLTRPWKAGSRKIANRESGTILAIDAAGNARVELDRGAVVKWSIPRNPHLEYAYARTSYSEQSTTVPKMLLHLDVGDSRIRTLLDKALVYVGASRGEQELLVCYGRPRNASWRTEPRESRQPQTEGALTRRDSGMRDRIRTVM